VRLVAGRPRIALTRAGGTCSGGRRRGLLALALGLLLLGPAGAVAAPPWAWLGVRIRDLSEQEMEEISARHGLGEGYGVLVVEVLEHTPAALAGLRSGDLVVAVGNRPVTETRQLQRLIAAAPVGSELRLTLLRSRGRQHVTVRLAPMPKDVAGERVAAEFGFALRETPPGEESGGPRLGAGLPAVAVVVPGSPAARAGLEVGDVVVRVDGREVLTRDAARDALADASLDRRLELVVRRQGRQLPLSLDPPPPLPRHPGAP
jgi:serine protease Do